jgi:hypothetical protein
LRAGLITSDHVDVLHRAYRLMGPSRFRLVEEALVDTAITERFTDFEQTVEYVIVRAAPADADERARRAMDERGASSSAVGDGGQVDASMERLGFDVWQAELERLTDAELARDRAEAKDRLGRTPSTAELRRTTRQRRVDAMVEMARRSAAHDGRGLGARPFVTTVHVDPVFLTALIKVLTEALNPDRDPGFDLDRALDEVDLTEGSLHELDDGTVVTVNTVVFALLTGTVRGILYDPDGEVLRFGRTRRLFSPAQAQAIRAMWRRCCHPDGCDRTGPATQSDHTIEHQHGGPTDLSNGERYCETHNKTKTNRHGEPPTSGAPPPDRSQRRTPRRC